MFGYSINWFTVRMYLRRYAFIILFVIMKPWWYKRCKYCHVYMSWLAYQKDGPYCRLCCCLLRLVSEGFENGPAAP